MKIIILLLLTAIFWGVTPILEKIGLSRTTPLIGLTIRSVIITLFLFICLLLSGNFYQFSLVDSKTFFIFAISGIMAGALGMLTYFEALKSGATSRIVPLVATYPLITSLLSILILRENVTLSRFLGTIFIVAGVWLVK